MAESKSDVIKILDVTPEDMELVLKHIHGALNTIPEERLQSLFLAADCLQVRHYSVTCGIPTDRLGPSNRMAHLD